jgi:4-hydroxybenzoate polyprenyltransferase
MSLPVSSAPAEVASGDRASSLAALVESLQPAQWVKNGFVFSALIFSHRLTDWHSTSRVTLAALVFCLVSSAAYLLNDILDAPRDRQHPVKRSRPVASGRLRVGMAACVAAG